MCSSSNILQNTFSFLFDSLFTQTGHKTQVHAEKFSTPCSQKSWKCTLWYAALAHISTWWLSIWVYSNQTRQKHDSSLWTALNEVLWTHWQNWSPYLEILWDHYSTRLFCVIYIYIYMAVYLDPSNFSYFWHTSYFHNVVLLKTDNSILTIWLC